MRNQSQQKGTDMEYCTTIGIDVSDRESKVCVMTKEDGERRILGMTKAGNELVRTVLTECAQVVMKSNAKDTDLKPKGLRIAATRRRKLISNVPPETCPTSWKAKDVPSWMSAISPSTLSALGRWHLQERIHAHPIGTEPHMPKRLDRRLGFAFLHLWDGVLEEVF